MTRMLGQAMCVLALALGMATPAQADPGDIDTSFGTGGQAALPAGLVATALAEAPDGKIVVAATPAAGPDDFVILRYDADGSVDGGFGGGDGMASIDMGGDDTAHAVAIQNDRKIVLAGISDLDLAVARLDADGNPDGDFDADGKVVTPVQDPDGTGYEAAHDVLVQPDGKIVVGGIWMWAPGPESSGYLVARYLPGGTLDAGFASGYGGGPPGTAVVYSGTGGAAAGGIALGANGDVILGGVAWYPYANPGTQDLADFGIARLSSGGAKLADWETDFAGRDDVGADVLFDHAGKIVMAGSTTDGADAAIARYGATGALDPSFSGEGRQSFPGEAALAVHERPDGRLVMIGETTGAGGENLLVRQLLPDGSPDPAFGTGGRAVGPPAGTPERSFAYIDPPRGLGNGTVQRDGGILAAGTSVVRFEGTDTFPGGGWSAPATAKGDFDGDGYADLAVAAPSEDIGAATAAGVVHVFRGSANGLTTAGVRTWSQNSPGIAGAAAAGDEFGAAVAVGDLNGDGRSELAVGVPGENGAAGAVHVLYGSATGLTATDSQYFSQDTPSVAEASEPEDRFGAALAIGDLGRTAHRELVAGAPGETVGTRPSAGGLHILYGAAGRLSAAGSQYYTQDTGLVADTSEQGDAFGSALAIHDFGRTGERDLAVGVPGEDLTPGQDAGTVHVLYGTSSGLSNGSHQLAQNASGIADEPEPGDHFGATMAAANLGSSAHADLAIGTPGEDLAAGYDAGIVHVLYGAADGIWGAGSQSWSQNSAGIVDTPEPGDGFGSSLAAANFGFDVNGTASDLAVGVPAEDTPAGADAGTLHVLFGTSTGLSANGSQSWTQNSAGLADDPEPGDRFGASLAAANFGKTSQGDLVVGSPGESLGAATGAGVVHALYSNPTLTGAGSQLFSESSTGNNPESGDGFGSSLGR